MDIIKRVEHKVIFMPKEHIPKHQRLKSGAKIDVIGAALDRHGRDGWVFVGRLGEDHIVFAREYTEPSPIDLIDKSCGNCKHWRLPGTAGTRKDTRSHGMCRRIRSDVEVQDRWDPQMAIINTMGQRPSPFATMAEFGCFMWEGYEV